MDSKKIKSLARHLLFWVVVMLVFAISEWGYRDNLADAVVLEMVFLPVRLVAVYVNLLVLIPRLLYRNQVLKYLFAILLTLFLLAIFQRYLTIYWAYPKFFPHWVKSATKPLDPWVFFRIVQNLVIIATPVAFSMGIKIFLDWYREKTRAERLEKEKITAELKYLKSQVNPHFLFNTLNSIYGLSIEKSRKVPGMILKLSDLLSYSLYESNQRYTDLRKEMVLIKDYIALEQERYDKRVEVDWKVSDEACQKVQIAPLILMPLVENAFKHGVAEETLQAKIWIWLDFKDATLLFEVRNTLPVGAPLETNGKKGIGLRNLQRRLELLYPKKYDLSLEQVLDEENQRIFVASLKIQLDG